MKQKASYLSVKIISAAIFIYSFVFLFGLIYGLYGLRKIQNSPAAAGHEDILHRLMLTMIFFGVDGLMAVIGSLGLFLHKKFGFYLTLLSIIVFWTVSSQQGGGLALNWNALLVATIVLVYLLFQRKVILEK